MSVLIMGMKMPKDGAYWCEINVAGDIALITIHGEDRKSFHLVELPDHGDLVDRDELMMKTWEASAYAPNHCSWVIARVVFAKDIEDAPVVIPAERSEE